MTPVIKHIVIFSTFETFVSSKQITTDELIQLNKAYSKF